MYDVKSAAKRYFEVALDVSYDNDTGKKMIVNVAPAKLKLINRLMRLSKEFEDESTGADALVEYQEAIRKLLSNNKEGVKVPFDFVEELDIDELNGLLMEYFAWMNAKIANDPN